jgi:hypothetical protein
MAKYKHSQTSGLVVLNTLNVSSPTVKYLKGKWSNFILRASIYLGLSIKGIFQEIRLYGDQT